MINMNIKTSNDFKTLSKRLRQFKSEVKAETDNRLNELHKTTRARYERVIDNEVYSKYNPISYERTEHIKGRHGAAVESAVFTGDNKSYDFYIEERSRDPVDGKTWEEKAYNLEHGSTNMFGTINPMPNRPFISLAVAEMKKQGQKHHNEYMRKINQSLKRL